MPDEVPMPTEQRDPVIVRTVVHTICLCAFVMVLQAVISAILEQLIPAALLSETTAKRLDSITMYVLGVLSGLLISTKVGK